MSTTHYRKFCVAECRMAHDDDERHFAGYAATFFRSDDAGTEFQLGHDLFERVMPGAFDAALDESQDVLALFNHDPNYVLGRTNSGTLELSVDDVGLRYSIRFDGSDPDHVKVASKLERGDVTGSSFAFSIREQGQSFTRDGDRDIRELRALDLHDVSIVTFPAYESSSSQLRGLVDCEAWRKERRSAKSKATRQKLIDDMLFRAR